MSHISLTIPSDDEKALVAGATMLLTLAGKIPEMELPEADTVTHGGSGDLELPGMWAGSDFTGGETDSPESTEPSVGMELAPGPTEPDDGGEPIRPTEPDDVPLDADGLPWDARIHSGSRAKIADGTWRKKRGVDEEDYKAVVEELKQLMTAPVVAPEPAGDGVSDDTVAVQAQVPPPPPAAEEPAAAPPPPPPVAAAEVPDTFPAFLKAVTHKVQAKELTIEEVNQALAPHGVANLQLLGGRPDLIPQIWASLVTPK